MWGGGVLVNWQAAYLSKHPEHISQTFYKSIPCEFLRNSPMHLEWCLWCCRSAEISFANFFSMQKDSDSHCAMCVWMDGDQLLCFGQCLWSLRLQQSLLVRPWFQQHIRLSTSQLHSVVSLGWKSSTHQKNIMGRFMFPRSPTYLWL